MKFTKALLALLLLLCGLAILPRLVSVPIDMHTHCIGGSQIRRNVPMSLAFAMA